MDHTEDAVIAAQTAKDHAASAIHETKIKAEHLAKELKHRVEDTIEESKEALSEAKHKAENRAEELKIRADHQLSEEREAMQAAKHRAENSTEDSKRKAEHRLEEATNEGSFVDRVKDKVETVFNKDLDKDGKIG